MGGNNGDDSGQGKMEEVVVEKAEHFGVFLATHLDGRKVKSTKTVGWSVWVEGKSLWVSAAMLGCDSMCLEYQRIDS